MADLKGPLFSLGATGSLGNAVTYQKRRRSKTARSKPTPSQPNTIPQQNSRALLTYLTALWLVTPELGKAPWNSIAGSKGATGYNRMLSQNIASLATVLDLSTWALADEQGQGLPMLSLVLSIVGPDIRATPTNPTPPPGWVFVSNAFVGMQNFDPRTTPLTNLGGNLSVVPNAPVILTVVSSGAPAVCSAFTQWTKPDGSTVYSPSLTDTI